MDSKITKLNLLMSIVGAILLATAFLACHNANSFALIEGPTELLVEPEWKDAPGNQVITILQKGERGRVIHVRYSKSCMFHKIKLDDGRAGYIMFGDKFRILTTIDARKP